MPAFTIAPRIYTNALLRTPAHMQASAVIRNQRALQVAAGYDAAHDALHDKGELAAAAICYLFAATGRQNAGHWPWDGKPKFDTSSPARLKNLVHAAALIHAEIERVFTLSPLYASHVAPGAAAAAACQGAAHYDGFCDATGAPPDEPLPYPQQASPITSAA